MHISRSKVARAVFCDAGGRPDKAEFDLNSVALWRDRAVQSTPEIRRAVSERSEFARRRGRRTVQGTLPSCSEQDGRVMPRPTWFWVLFPKEKDLGRRDEPRQYQSALGHNSLEN